MSLSPHEVIPCPSIPIRKSRAVAVPEGFDHFTFGRLRFEFLAREEFSLPRYKGSVFRAGLGAALRQIACSPGRNGQCGACLLAGECAYARLIETPVRPGDSGLTAGMADAPHPMVLRPPLSSNQHYKTGDSLVAEVILIGDAMRFTPQLICAFHDFSRAGIGNSRGKFSLERVFAVTGGACKSIYACGDSALKDVSWAMKAADLLSKDNKIDAGRLTVTLETPLRAKLHGSLCDTLNFQSLMKSILRRIRVLDSLYCDGTMAFDHRKLIALSAHVETIAENIWWVDWTRYSHRQKASLKMGGLIGNLEFQGEFSEFMAFLRLGEILHVGKGTAYGMGKYSLRTVDGS